jgi:hypothetical protein
MKGVILVLSAVFVVALAIVVGSRMSADAMAVVVGVTCGVLASIPTSLLVIWATNRRADSGVWRDRQPGAVGMGSQYPPVVVVNSGERYARPALGAQPYWPEQTEGLLSPGREFKVVGEPDWDTVGWRGPG